MYVCYIVLYNIHNPGSQAESYSFSIFNTSSEEPFVSRTHPSKCKVKLRILRHENA